MKKKSHIAIIGSGLVGSLLSLYLIKRGYLVSIFERRGDIRKGGDQAGRSINLALSNRGLRALAEVDLANKMADVMIPLHGRMVHDIQGKIVFLPYGKQGEYINSVSRGGLNAVLMNEAERLGVSIHFEQRVQHVNLEKTRLILKNASGETSDMSVDYIIGADGAFSAVRSSLQITDRFDYNQHYIAHGYKELTIPADKKGEFQLEKNALHIWPRESYMLIALPNPDGSFTCTLFFPFEGSPSFQSLQTDENIISFFKEIFPDATELIPDLLTEFKGNPTGSLVTVKCYPWVKNKIFLIGDAAHAIVPFYGQGMNAGFEDCRVLNDLLNEHSDDWSKVLEEYQQLRKPDADAIAQLAMDNFVEMRDLVADESFVLRKKIEAKLHQLYPEKWIPLYGMITFHDEVRYSDAQKTGKRQKEIMDEVMKQPAIETNWQSLDFEKIINQLTSPR